jgi:ADP-heptose:LPS heptosyltransferase
MRKMQILKLLDQLVGRVLCALPGQPSPRKPQKTNIRNILVIRPGGIGDAVLLLPAIVAIKIKYPNDSITVLAEKRNAEVFKLCSAIGNLFLYDSPKDFLAATLGKYDVVIDTEQWHRLSAVVARFTRAQVRIGFSTNERSRLFTHHIPYSHDEYEANSFLNLLMPLGIDKHTSLHDNFLSVPEIAKQRAEELLGNLSGKSFIAIFPGGSIPERRWGAERFKGLTGKLNAEGIPVVVVGGKEDVSAGEIIIAGNYGINLAGKTSLVETAAVIEKSAVLVSGDSGILHVGVALGRPTVSLLGPGIAKKWAPRGPRHIVINKNLPCSPCTKFGYTPKCPINARCMAEITVGEVVGAVEKLNRTEEAKR